MLTALNSAFIPPVCPSVRTFYLVGGPFTSKGNCVYTCSKGPHLEVQRKACCHNLPNILPRILCVHLCSLDAMNLTNGQWSTLSDSLILKAFVVLHEKVTKAKESTCPHNWPVAAQSGYDSSSSHCLTTQEELCLNHTPKHVFFSDVSCKHTKNTALSD